MFAGTDTTSYTLMKCALVLDRNPEWFQRLKDEQDQLRAEYGDAIDRKVSACRPQPLHIPVCIHVCAMVPACVTGFKALEVYL